MRRPSSEEWLEGEKEVVVWGEGNRMLRLLMVAREGPLFEGLGSSTGGDS